MATVTTAPTRSTAPATTPRNLLEIQPLEFESHFTREPFLIRHHLSDHPLFQIERLLELAKALPPENIEYNAGQLPLSVDPNMTPMNGLSVAETIERIQTCKSWMAIKYVENDPKYRDLLHACLDEVRPHSEPIAPGMQKAHGFIFLSSPNSVTPYHIDPEHNFLLQIRGGKTIGMYDGRDKTLLTEQNLEGFYSDKHRNMKLDEARKDDCWKFDLQPGMGLHFPVTYPHWVQNQNEVSVSFSITFRTPDLDKRRALYSINHALRERGYSPTPVGKNKLRDAVYFQAFRVWRKLTAQPEKSCQRTCNAKGM